MTYYCFDLNRVPRVILLGKETLSKSRFHYTRYVSEYLLYVITSGSLELLVNDEVVTLAEGDIYLFKRGDYQEPISAGDCEYYYVHFTVDDSDADILELDDAEYPSIISNKRLDNLKLPYSSAACYDFMKVYIKAHTHISSSELFDYIVATLKNNTVSEDSRLAERRFRISAAFVDVLFKIEDANQRKLERAHASVDKIIDYVEKNYARPFSGADIEADLYLNFDYANRMLGKAIGMSIMKYRNTVRINNAKVMIRTSNRSFSEIAGAVGYESVYYFSRMFKKIEGISPTEYKQQILYGKLTGKDKKYEKN